MSESTSPYAVFPNLQAQDLLDGLQVPRVKRHHRKSRLGCAVCKRRRIKCDETKPSCWPCRKKGLSCVYGNGTTASSNDDPLPSPANAASNSTLPSPQSASPENGSQTPALEQQIVEASELARVYFEHVAYSFSNSSVRPEQTWIWHVFVPAQSYSSDTVRHGMLTAAAIYLFFITPQHDQMSAKTLDTANWHGTAFVEQSMSQLHHLSPLMAVSHIACTRLLGVLGLAFFRYRRERGGNGDSMEWTWVHLLKGVPTVHATLSNSGPALPKQLVDDMVLEHIWSPASFGEGGSAEGGILGAGSSVLAYIAKTRQQRFTTLQFALDQEWLCGSDRHPEAFAKIIQSLHDITYHVCNASSASLFRTVFSWIGTLPDNLTALLAEDYPGMLAVYTHWLMLVVLVEDLWWVGNMGRSGIRASLNILRAGESGLCLAPVLSWPRELLDM